MWWSITSATTPIHLDHTWDRKSQLREQTMQETALQNFKEKENKIERRISIFLNGLICMYFQTHAWYIL